MGTSEKKISQVPEGLSRPSLLSSGAPSAGHNILDAMGGRHETAPASARPRRLWWLLVSLVAATAWGIATQLAQPPALRSAHPTVAQRALPPVPAVVTAVPSPVGAAAEQPITRATATTADPFQSLAATPPVNATAPAPSSPATTELPAQATAPPQAGLATAGPVAEQKPMAAPPKAVAKAATPSTARPATTVARKAAAPTTKTLARAGNPPKKQARQAAIASRKTGDRDPDVELLGAIMKHLGNGQGVATAAAPSRSARTIAELVQSCRTKDAIEALLCQRRICEGSWGKAQACPLNLAPKTAKVQAPA